MIFPANPTILSGMFDRRQPGENPPLIRVGAEWLALVLEQRFTD